jgi:hypothetical protein
MIIPSGSQPLAAVLVLAISSAACGGTTAPLEPPVIAAFAATPPAIVVGAASVLTWDVRGADAVRIDVFQGTLRGTGLLVTPASNATYVLVAANAAGETRSMVLLPVSAPTLPPDDPADLLARGLSGGGAVVSWSLSGLASGYIVERKASFDVDYLPLATVDGAQVVLFDTSATANQFYRYRVRATSVAGSSPGAVATVVAPPAPPEGPSLSVTPATVLLAPGGELVFTSSGPAAWAVLEGAAGGAINSAGRYQAPAGAGTWHVVADGGVSAVATVVVQ